MMTAKLREWVRGADQGSMRQALFVLEDLLWLVGSGLDYEEYRDLAVVIGEHTSNGIRLPVYQLSREDLGLRLVMRNNFHDWKLSVDSRCGISDPSETLSVLFHTTPPIEREYTGDDLAKCYFEGFRQEDIFGYYCKNSARWSACIADNYRLWAAVFHIMMELGAIGPMIWRTRASHAAEIEAAKARRLKRTGT